MELCKEGVATDVILRSAATQWNRDGRDSPFANRGGKRGVLKATGYVERRFGRCGSLGLDPGRHHFMSLTGLGKLEVANLFSWGCG